MTEKEKEGLEALKVLPERKDLHELFWGAIIFVPIAWWTFDSDYFLLRLLGALCGGVANFIVGTLVLSILYYYLKCLGKSRLIIYGLITVVIFKPLASWGVFNSNILIKIIGVCIVLVNILLLGLAYNIFTKAPLEKPESEDNIQTPQAKPAAPPKPAAQPKQATRPTPQPKPIIPSHKQKEQTALQSDGDYWLLLNEYYEDIGMACYEQSNLKCLHIITNRPITEIRNDLKIITARYKDLHGVSEPSQRSETAQAKLVAQAELAAQTKPATQAKPNTPPKPDTQSKPAVQSKPVTQSKPATKAKPTSQPKSVTQAKPTKNQETTVACSSMLDLFVASLKDKDYCFDSIHGFLLSEAEEIRNTIDLNCLLATWVKDFLIPHRVIQIQDNDVTFSNYVHLQSELSALLSFLIKKNENYSKVHISLFRPISESDVDKIKKLYNVLFGIKDDELKIVGDVISGQGKVNNLQAIIEKVKFNFNNVEKIQQTREEPNIENANEKFYSFVRLMSNDDLLACIDNEYRNIKGHHSLAPCMGEYGCFEFASALLLWNYARKNFLSNQRPMGQLQIGLADVIGCAFFGMPAGEWSDKIDVVINNNLSVLKYKEWSKVYAYLRNNFAESIHSMEFNEGNALNGQYVGIYKDFIALYNTINEFSEIIDYYDSNGMHLKKDIKFRIDG